MRHPCERGTQRELRRVVLFAVRDALNSPAHPDSKRQARRKERDLTRYGGRILKQASVTSCPVTREMRKRIREEQEKFAAACAARLLGRKYAT